MGSSLFPSFSKACGVLFLLSVSYPAQWLPLYSVVSVSLGSVSKQKTGTVCGHFLFFSPKHYSLSSVHGFTVFFSFLFLIVRQMCLPGCLFGSV